MQILPTPYAGIEFRSRTEARWAVFFDALGIEWGYEPEGYDLGEAGWYLPDFWLPTVDAFFEVKGAKPSMREESRAQRLASFTGKACFIAFGPLPHLWTGRKVYDFPKNFNSYVDKSGIIRFDSDGVEDFPYYFCVCPACGEVGIEFEGRGERVCGNRCCQTERAKTAGSYRIRNAFARATAERFGT